jgi:hypothetical protein
MCSIIPLLSGDEFDCLIECAMIVAGLGVLTLTALLTSRDETLC